MDDGERQQITPLVHDGVMFVSTVINNTVQALNATTGDLIWENRLGPRLENQVNATARAMALYGDQLFYPATDANLYALDARTGKINWKFKISSYGSDKIGGLMIADGKLIVGLGVCDERFAGRTAASSPPMTSRTATRSGNSHRRLYRRAGRRHLGQA